MSSCCSKQRAHTLDSIQNHYSRFVQNDGHILGNANGGGLEGLGYYDAEFLAMCGLVLLDAASSSTTAVSNHNNDGNTKEELLRSILEPSCGSGCPLRLLLLQLNQEEEDNKEKMNKNNKPVLTSLPSAVGPTVVDLGCGAGHDVILASSLLSNLWQQKQQQQQKRDNIIMANGGHVIGVDVTEDMLALAEVNIQKFRQFNNNNNKAASESSNNNNNNDNVIQIDLIHDAFDISINELELTGLLSPNMADIVISNGVFNLTRDKKAAFTTAYWLLKPGGRLLLSDVCRVIDNDRPGPDAFFSPNDSKNPNNNDGGWSA